MTIRWGLFALAWMTPLAWAEPPAKLFYTSETDFTEMTLTLKKPMRFNPSPSMCR